MHRFITILLACLVLAMVPEAALAGTGRPPTFVGDGDNAPYGYRPDAIEVTFAIGERPRAEFGGRLGSAELSRFIGANTLSLELMIPDINVYVFHLPAGVEPAQRVRTLRGHAEIRSVSVVPYGHAADALVADAAGAADRAAGRGVEGPLALTPNDPLFPQQWNLAQIQDPSAWDLVSFSYIVGIIDTGVNAVQDLSIVGSVNFSADADANDDYSLNRDGHGTPMAGIAAALTNNGVGVAGVAGPNGPSVYNIKVIDQTNSTDATRVANAINWAANNGIYVLNLSLVVGCTQGLLDAIQYAWTSNHVVVGSTGNDNSSNFNGNCPAASSYAIAVGATDGRYSTDGSTAGTDLRWCAPCGDPPYDTTHGANYGSPGIDVSAPSTFIRLTSKVGDYQNWSWAGTSGAAAHVSGLVAMMMYRWGLPTADFIRSKLDNSADKVGGYNYGWSTYCGGQSAELGCGRINAYRAMQ